MQVCEADSSFFLFFSKNSEILKSQLDLKAKNISTLNESENWQKFLTVFFLSIFYKSSLFVFIVVKLQIDGEPWMQAPSIVRILNFRKLFFPFFDLNFFLSPMTDQNNTQESSANANGTEVRTWQRFFQL